MNISRALICSVSLKFINNLRYIFSRYFLRNHYIRVVQFNFNFHIVWSNRVEEVIINHTNNWRCVLEGPHHYRYIHASLKFMKSLLFYMFLVHSSSFYNRSEIRYTYYYVPWIYSIKKIWSRRVFLILSPNLFNR